MQEGHNDSAASTFYPMDRQQPSRLPVAQQEASGWWDAPYPHSIGFHPRTFSLPLLPADPQDFWVTRQEKDAGFGPGITGSCQRHQGPRQAFSVRAAMELEQCMAPLMTLNEDNVVEASLC